ncbi:hypothetical protein MMC22_002459 [Lobaria immixta]|nr:hypothetical protein [Lobaria immixta]
MFLATAVAGPVALAAAATAAGANPALNTFLTNSGVSPSRIPASVLAQGGTSLSCGILDSIRSEETVSVRDGNVYVTEREAHWSAVAWDSPTCIFTPNTTDHVRFAVGLLKVTGTKYAVRSGGHSPHEDFASIKNGVLISMTGIKDVTYDATSETARLGMGIRWGDVYAALDKYDRGLSHRSNEYGWAADNVQNFEIVLADGELTNANATSKSDLFWALKGGQNNFGVVTHITTRAIPSPSQLWGGLLLFNGSQQDAVISAYAKYQEKGQLDKKSALIADLVLSNDTLALTLVYFGPTEKPAAFEAFYGIPSVRDTTKLHSTFIDIISEGLPNNIPRWSYGYTNLGLDEKTYVDVLNICKEQGKKLADVNGGTLVVNAQPISKSMVTYSSNTGGNPLGLTPRAQLWLNVSFGWNLESDDAKIFALIDETIAKVEALTKARNLYDPFIFLNDAFKNQKVFQSWGADNFAKLKAVSAKYDPSGVFQHQVPGGFKLV